MLFWIGVLWIAGACAGVAGGRYMWMKGAYPMSLGWGDIILLTFLSLLMGPAGFVLGGMWYLIAVTETKRTPKVPRFFLLEKDRIRKPREDR